MSPELSLPVVLHAGDIKSTIGVLTLPAGSSSEAVRRAVADLLRAAADEIDGPETWT